MSKILASNRLARTTNLRSTLIWGYESRGFSNVLQYVVVMVVGLSAMPALAKDFIQKANTPSGPIRVMVRPVAGADPTPIPTTAGTRIGVPYFGMMSGVIANAFDETGKFKVSTPTHLPVTGVAFNTPMRSDFIAALGQVCSAGKLNYAVFGTQEGISASLDPLSMTLLGGGAPTKTISFEMRVYDCKSNAVVWDKTVAIEDHQAGGWPTAQSGAFTFYSGDPATVGSKVIVAKLMTDLGW